MVYNLIQQNTSASFSGTMTVTSTSFNTTDTVSNSNYAPKYVYFGYWYNGAYQDVNKWNVEYHDGAFTINYAPNGDIWAEFNLNISRVTGMPIYPYYNQITAGAVNNISEIFPTNYPVQFIVCFSVNNYSNDWSTLSTASDVTICIYTISITNPAKITQTYPISFYSDNSLIQTIQVSYSGSRDQEQVCPVPMTISGCQNANQMGVTKPGYRGIGWDTSSSATTVVYGSKNASGSFTIPAGTLSDTTPYNLYAVWEKALNLKVWVNGELKTVTDIRVVTSISGSTANTSTVTSGKVYDGSSWRDF